MADLSSWRCLKAWLLGPRPLTSATCAQCMVAMLGTSNEPILGWRPWGSTSAPALSLSHSQRDREHGQPWANKPLTGASGPESPLPFVWQWGHGARNRGRHLRPLFPEDKQCQPREALPLRSTPQLPLSSHTLLASLPSGVQLILPEGLWWRLSSAFAWTKMSLFHALLKDIFARREFQFGSSSCQSLDTRPPIPVPLHVTSHFSFLCYRFCSLIMMSICDSGHVNRGQTCTWGQTSRWGGTRGRRCARRHPLNCSLR